MEGTKLSKRQQSLYTKFSPVEVFVGAGPLPQAHLQEFGTHKEPPQPFLRPAVDSKIQEVAERFAGRLKEEIMKSAERSRRKQAKLLSKIK
jgi:HK97 gp10 family phage protein